MRPMWNFPLQKSQDHNSITFIFTTNPINIHIENSKSDLPKTARYQNKIEVLIESVSGAALVVRTKSMNLLFRI